MTEQERVTPPGFDITKWSSRLRSRDIAVGWGLLIAAGLVVGAVASWMGSTFLRDVAANYVPDIFVGGLAFILADVIFGFRERQARRAEERHEVVGAQRKAYHLLIRELGKNVDLLARTVNNLKGGRMIPSDTNIERNNWELLLQSPLSNHIPLELFWALQESYYVSHALVNELIEAMLSTDPSGHAALAKSYLPMFEEELDTMRLAVTMLEQAYLGEE